MSISYDCSFLDTDDVKDLKPLNDRVLIKVAEVEEKLREACCLVQQARRSLPLARFWLSGLVFSMKKGTVNLYQFLREALSSFPSMLGMNLKVLMVRITLC
nr:20 kDa chaperonin, chloroplastic [Ipomoea batatas]GMD32197.1 20 kDa chaperonin, chloroplastic [Ipomoea batatas]GMD35384.1 20 kDa chaperonin, chloroplastic [Ipomoea batatas]